MTMKEWAIKYHRMGLAVIPLKKKGKTPLIESWAQYQKRRPTEDEINEWWTKYPDANIGIITGLISGIVVLDPDGAEAMESLKGRYMPPTAVSKTGSGWHYFYKHPGRQEVKNWTKRLPGCDFRGDGGYIVAPPSIHPSGATYEWLVEITDRDDLAEVPEWLMELLQVKSTIHLVAEDDAEAWYAKAMLGVGEGERNDIAAKLAGRYFGMGMSHAEIAELMKAWNTKNKPPIPAIELDKTIQSIMRAENMRNITNKLQNGDETAISAVDMEDAKDIILAALQQNLEGIKVYRLLKYKTDPPLYAIETALGTKMLGAVENLSSQSKFRNRIIEAENIVLKEFRANVWRVIVQNLLNICDEIDVSDDATETGQMWGWIRDYLQIKEPTENLEDAAAYGLPFIRNDRIHIFAKKFNQYVSKVSIDKLTDRVMGMKFKRIGSDSVTIKISGRVYRVWQLPELPEDA